MKGNYLNKIISLILLLAGFFSAFNFYKAPIFHALCAVIFLLTFVKVILNKLRFELIIDNVSLYGFYFVVFSIPAYLLSIYSFSSIESTTFFYFVMFFCTYTFMDKRLKESWFFMLLKCILISTVLITLLGWLIRLGFLRYDFFVDYALESEHMLGYWGIRYAQSTRNADYLYPLVGLAISLFFYTRFKFFNYILLFAFFNVTLLASLSRGAMIISFFSFLLMFLSLDKRGKRFFLIFIFVCLLSNYKIISTLYNEIFSSILNSIFSLTSTESKYSNSERLIMTMQALQAATINPIGYGIDNYSSIYKIFGFEGQIKNTAENAFLTILVERGWLSFLSIIFILISAFLSSFRHFKSERITTLNLFVCPFLLIYMSFNYEFNSIFLNYIFFIIFVGHTSMIRNRSK